MKNAILLRKVRGKFDAFIRNGRALYSAPGNTAPTISTLLGVFIGVLFLPVVMIGAFALLMHTGHDGNSFMFAGMGITATGLSSKRQALELLKKELSAGVREMESGPITVVRAKELELKAEEATDLQRELKTHTRMSEVLNPLIPTGESMRRTKSIGQAFVESEVFQNFKSESWARGVPSPKFVTDSPFETKAVSLSEGFVTPYRDSRAQRTEEMQRPTIRNVLDVRPAPSGSEVDYIVVDPGDVAAEPVPKGEEKPEADVSLDKAKAKVETIAVTCPIDESDIDDIPGIVRLIDDELTYQLKLVEERQMLFGSGTSPNLQGLLTHPDILESESAGSQLLDFIAACQRDVRLAQFNPDFVAIHPEDWFTITTLKDNTERYIYGDPQLDPDGMRIWGMNVVVTNSAMNPESGARSILVGDGKRGATIYDRRQVSMQLGYVNNQFRLNKRTIRVEERLAFAIRAPLAFRKLTAAEGSGTYGTGTGS